ncbi:MAG: cytochrome c-type biosis protein CcmE [Solirubrobacterales bacterium]|jgi:cytochrome c-type biogenesis protein CcmE|nr:cytochrome c-type biosis protein CcmE [Solirubrobacterales bacterium]
MDPDRKRQIRLVVALSAAVLLAVALVYTSFSAATEAKDPSQLLTAQPGQSYDVTGVVVPGSIKHHGQELDFRVADRQPDGSAGPKSVPVRYTGEVPDPFRAGREIIVTGRLTNQGALAGKRDSLITKCPSKFTQQAQQDPKHVIINQ